MKRSCRVAPGFLESLAFLLCGLAVAGAAEAAPCPISSSGCRATAAEAQVKHDFPDQAYVQDMKRGCLAKAVGRRGFRNDYCGCIADTMSATPGEWRAIILAGMEGRGLSRERLSALPPALGMQIRSQARSCMNKVVAGTPSGGASMTFAPQPPVPVYAHEVARMIAGQVGAIRVRQEQRAMASHGGMPVVLPSGVSRVELTVAPDGQVTQIRDIDSSSAALWRVELAAIREVAPFPPPGRELHLRIATIASHPTPGVDGQ